MNGSSAADERNRGTLVLLLAGGQGERLYPLTKKRAKPAVAFGGPYRIVDFTIANCLNSGLRRIYVLTQHKSLSVDRHLRVAWSGLRPEFGEFVQTVPPQLQLVSRWYAGTADAVFQNLHLLEEERPERILIVSGDHIYRMDYRPLLDFHANRCADLTLACTRVPCAEATRMGVLAVDRNACVEAFNEKPAQPASLPDDTTRSLVNMGVYVFDAEPLIRAVIADAKHESAHDFGRDILPRMMASGRVHAFDTTERCPAEQQYWQDVGTLDSYFEANMALLSPRPSLDLLDARWPVRTGVAYAQPSLLRNAGGQEGRATNSIFSPGCIVDGGAVLYSVLSPGVFVAAGAIVEHSILMAGVRVGERAVIRRAIVDEGVVIPPGASIGVDRDVDRKRFVVTESGLVVVPERAVLD